VRALTGTDPDRLKEEQERGITIDLGFAHLQAGDLNLAFVDVPGHERFVRNMLAGAGGIDLVMLVVAADESVMPQTREHFQICRLLQVPAGIIVLTKSDAADPEMVELAGLEVRELVAGSFLDGAPLVPVSAKTGAGLDGLLNALTTAASELPVRRSNGPARLPIDRVFTVKGFGTVVTGTLVSGHINQDDALALLPAQTAVTARGLQVHGRAEGAADAGRRVAVNLGGIELADVRRGDTLCTPQAFQPTRRIDALVDVLDGARGLRHGVRVRFHQGTTEVLGRVAVARRTAEDDDQVAPGAEIAAGASGYARIRFEAPAVLTRGDRFILRAYSPPVTIGGGVVLDPHPPRSAIRTAAGAARFARLDPSAAAPDEEAVLAFIDDRGAAGLARSELTSRAGLPKEAAERVEQTLVANGQAVRVGSFLLSPAVLQDLAQRLLRAVTAHHDAQPLSDGLSREEARERLFRGSAPPVFEHVLAMLTGSAKILASDRLTVAGRSVSLSPEETRARDTIEQLFREGGLGPPDIATVSAAAGVPPAVVDRVAKLLVRQKTLVKVEALLFHSEALLRLRVDMQALKESEGASARVDIAAFKARYGITRKHAIPLLEFLDRERVTRRVGDSRVVL
jgi:selenocysteine-specific elongation factor